MGEYSTEDQVEIILLDRQKPVVCDLHGLTLAEELCFRIAWESLQARPVAFVLYGLYDRTENRWISPHEPIEVEASSSMELRLRIKVPDVVKLHKTCQNTFNYCYHQLRHDFLRGRVIDKTNDPAGDLKDLLGGGRVDKNESKLIKKPRFQFIKNATEVEELNQRKEEHVNRISHVLRMMHLLMTVDVQEGSLGKKSSVIQ